MRPTILPRRRRCATIPASRFAQLMDLCGVDYSTYGEGCVAGQALRRHLASALGGTQLARASCGCSRVTTISRWWTADRQSGPAPTGTSAKPSTCLASCSPAIPTCAASSPTTVSSDIRSARIFRSPAMSRCATTRSKSASSTSR